MIELEHQMAVLADLELNYKDSMLEVNGIGEKKFTQFGEAFLDVINS
jgi:hypothetical protein